MLTDLIREHKLLADQIQALETQIEKERAESLAALPSEFGFTDLDSFIRAIRQAVRPQRRQKVARKKRDTTPASKGLAPKPRGLAAATPLPPAPANPPSSPPVPQPTGTSLEDPAHFGLLPDASLLEQGSQDATTYHGKLSAVLKFAQEVLHTARVPAKIWREWRQFERYAIEVLRSAHKVSSDVVNE